MRHNYRSTIDVTMFIFRTFLYVVFAILAFPWCASAQNAGLDEDFKNSETLLLPIGFLDQQAVDRFYLARQGEPYWLVKNRLNNRGEVLLQILEDSWKNGLNPFSYNREDVARIIGDHRVGARLQVNQESLTRLELLLTDAYIRYARDLSGMRIKAKSIGLNPSDWRQPIDAPTALSYLGEETEIKSLLESLEPQGVTYRTLKLELERLVVEDGNALEEEFEPLVFNELVKPGRGYKNIPALRSRMGLDPAEENQRYTYDDDLARAVIEFQKANALKADGIVGRKTLALLNQGRKEKILQIIANLERLRWAEDQIAPRFIVVNLPSATLWAMKNGQVALEMPVIVGRPKRETPSFHTTITGVRFNPDWTVPPTIKKEDILPQLREDAGYLVDKGMEIYDGYGQDAQSVDPMAVDWNSVTETQMHGYRLVQIPGSHNPLGKVRVLMPNSYNVYLHDTNHGDLFSKSDRAQSSGCIRLKEPEKLAAFILSEKKGWSDEKLKSVLKSSKTKDIMIDSNIPVYLLYYTTWLGDKGQVIFGEDIYGRDQKLLAQLKKIDGFYIPQYNGTKLAKATD